jgi:hypothetical protein
METFKRIGALIGVAVFLLVCANTATAQDHPTSGSPTDMPGYDMDPNAAAEAQMPGEVVEDEPVVEPIYGSGYGETDTGGTAEPEEVGADPRLVEGTGPESEIVEEHVIDDVTYVNMLTPDFDYGTVIDLGEGGEAELPEGETPPEMDYTMDYYDYLDNTIDEDGDLSEGGQETPME